MAACNLDFFKFGVAREVQDLHAVTQRGRNLRRIVRRHDPEDAREVKRQLDKMIAERAVLRGIKHLKQCRRRIAVEVHRDLVDLIQQKHRVLRPCAANALDDAPRHCTDIGAAMPTDLRLIADAAERDADKLASHCARN